jgi:hypothetical protein
MTIKIFSKKLNNIYIVLSNFISQLIFKYQLKYSKYFSILFNSLF